MSTIRILPEILSNQIAAGEVVQRPSNAVKELVENSIDAGATKITIEVEKGGKSLIRVSDDGIGLSRDDALLSIERYATSKLHKKEDLFAISSMGFRGEALPSIASVSKFTMVTKPRKGDAATKIEIAGGRLQDVSEVGAPTGTMVEVRHLFYNTPARKKFLKSDQTEFGHIADTIWGMALGNPLIQFRLISNGRLHKSFSYHQDLKERAIEILGKDTRDKIYPLDHSEDGLHVHGFCVNPMVTRSAASRIFVFVNHRLVWDRGLIAAVFRGYHGRIMKGRFPLGVFFVDIDYDQVDVNVHPSKREIKFFNPARVYQAVAQAVEQAVGKAQKDIRKYSRTFSPPFEYTAMDPSGRQADQVAQQPLAFGKKAAEEKSMGSPEEKAPDSADRMPEINPVSEQKIPSAGTAAGNTHEYPAPRRTHLKDSPPENKIQEADVRADIGPDSFSGKETRIIGQTLGTYILAESREGLMLIDQHAAHERIVYEALKRRQDSLGPQAQQLAVPETMDLSHRESVFLQQHLQDFEKIGVVIQPFGGNTFVIKTVPVLMGEREIKPFLLEVIDKALENRELLQAGGWLEEMLVMMACHSAVRANHPLTRPEMEKLVSDLEKCENSRHCPHGRPIVIFWDQNRIEKLFKRVV